MAKTAPRKRTRRSVRAQKQVRMVFDRHNYVLLAAAVGLIAVGFAIMRIENQVDGFLSLYVSPLIILAGYAAVAYAILWHPKGTDEPPAEAPAARATR